MWDFHKGICLERWVNDLPTPAGSQGHRTPLKGASPLQCPHMLGTSAAFSFTIFLCSVDFLTFWNLKLWLKICFKYCHNQETFSSEPKYLLNPSMNFEKMFVAIWFSCVFLYLRKWPFVFFLSAFLFCLYNENKDDHFKNYFLLKRLLSKVSTLKWTNSTSVLTLAYIHFKMSPPVTKSSNKRYMLLLITNSCLEWFSCVPCSHDQAGLSIVPVLSIYFIILDNKDSKFIFSKYPAPSSSSSSPYWKYLPTQNSGLWVLISALFLF